MTKEELKAALNAIRWSAADLAAHCRLNESTVRRWLYGAYPVPADVAAWLRDIAAYLDTHPAP